MGIPKLVIRYRHAGNKHIVVAEDSGERIRNYPIMQIWVYRKNYYRTAGQILFRKDATWSASGSMSPWLSLWSSNGVETKLLNYYMYWYSPSRDLQFRRNA